MRPGTPPPILTCRECGKVLPSRPEVRYVISTLGNRPDKNLLLMGSYCCSDHLLDAWSRGVPKKYQWAHP